MWLFFSAVSVTKLWTYTTNALACCCYTLTFYLGYCILYSGVARNLIWGVYVLTSHCSFKTVLNVSHVNKTVTDFGGIYTNIPPVATPLIL